MHWITLSIRYENTNGGFSFWFFSSESFLWKYSLISERYNISYTQVWYNLYGINLTFKSTQNTSNIGWLTSIDSGIIWSDIFKRNTLLLWSGHSLISIISAKKLKRCIHSIWYSPSIIGCNRKFRLWNIPYTSEFWILICLFFTDPSITGRHFEIFWLG